MVADVKLHAYDATAASAYEFKRNAARAGEEIEGRRGVAEVDVALQDVEEVLLREVRRGPCREAAWYLDVPALVLAGEDSQRPPLTPP